MNVTVGGVVSATMVVTWGDKSRTVTLSTEEGRAVDRYLTGAVLITGAAWELVRETYHRALVESAFSPVRVAKTLWYYAQWTGRLFDEWDAP